MLTCAEPGPVEILDTIPGRVFPITVEHLRTHLQQDPTGALGIRCHPSEYLPADLPIDSPPLRRNVQHALNHGENYNQLHRAVSYANFGKLRFRSEEEQQIWSEASRLLTNCILYFNATILSELLARKVASGDNCRRGGAQRDRARGLAAREPPRPVRVHQADTTHRSRSHRAAAGAATNRARRR